MTRKNMKFMIAAIHGHILNDINGMSIEPEARFAMVEDLNHDVRRFEALIERVPQSVINEVWDESV